MVTQLIQTIRFSWTDLVMFLFLLGSLVFLWGRFILHSTSFLCHL